MSTSTVLYISFFYTQHNLLLHLLFALQKKKKLYRVLTMQVKILNSKCNQYQRKSVYTEQMKTRHDKTPNAEHCKLPFLLSLLAGLFSLPLPAERRMQKQFRGQADRQIDRLSGAS